MEKRQNYILFFKVTYSFKFTLYLSFFLLFTVNAFAQSEHETVLLQRLDTASSDLMRSKIYSELSDEVMYINPDKSFTYANHALVFAKKSKDIYSQAYANSCLGFVLYNKSDYIEALPYFEKELQLGRAIHDTVEIVYALLSQGTIYNYLGDNKRAITTLKYALELVEKINKQSLLVNKACNALGLVYVDIGEYQKAFGLLNKAKKIAIDLKHEYALDITLNNISLIYKEMGDFELALSTLDLTVDSMYDKQSIDYGIYLVNVGGILESMGEYDSAMDYYLEYLKIARNLGNQSREASALTKIAGVQLELNQLKQAFQNQKKANRIYKKLKVHTNYASGLVMMAKIHIKKKEYNLAEKVLKEAESLTDKLFNKQQKAKILVLKGTLNYEQKNYGFALKYYQEALDSFDKIGSKLNYATTLYQLALSQHQLQQYKLSIKNAKKSLALIQKSKHRIYLDDLYDLLSKNYAAIQDFENAYVYQIKLKNIQDSLFDIGKDQRFAELQTKFEVKEKETENKLLKSIYADNKLIIKRRTIMGLFLAGGLLTVMILLGWLINVNKQKRKYNAILESKVAERTNALQVANKDLKESYQELERFAYIASHDLKEPLRNIAGFAFLLKRKIYPSLDEESKGYMEFIVRGTRQMNALIVSVLEFSKLNGKILELTKVDANTVIADVSTVLKQALEARNVELQVDTLPQIMADEAKISLIFKNLIENGIKYNKSLKPIIKISCESVQKNHVFSVKDNGIGVEKEYEHLIFEMFKRLHNKQDYEGTGIGLAFSKKIITQHKGEIWLEKSNENGSVFKFSIPKEIGN